MFESQRRPVRAAALFHTTECSNRSIHLPLSALSTISFDSVGIARVRL